MESYDVIIVGGGAAGLSAALLLGRARRDVLVCDAGKPRNWASNALHGYLSRDGMPPAELLETARQELRQYPSVRLIGDTVTGAWPRGDRFEVLLANNGRMQARKLLLATGIADELPALEGIEAFYGKSVHHCPYCDGWEHRDKAIAVYGSRNKGAKFALMMKQWSQDIVLCTDGRAPPTAETRAQLEKHGIPIRTEKIKRLEGTGAQLERIVFANGDALPRQALFFTIGQHQRSSLFQHLGVEQGAKGGLNARWPSCQTCVPGVYVAGDASRDVQLLIVAAAEGACAALAINKALLAEDGLG
ncbi:MAG TPA: NAD(P)/FAD-dependent oxidoreductase [Hyphomicrobiaceae bacterium]